MTNKNKLFSIYGASNSKNGDRVNISIVTGEGDSKQWGTISLKKESTGKTKVIIKDGYVYLKIPFLQQKQFDNDIPFN